MSKRWDRLRQQIRSYLREKSYKLEKTPKSFYKDMIAKTGESYNAISSVFYSMRKKAGCRPSVNKPKKHQRKTPLYKHIEAIGAIRTQPSTNTSITKEVRFELSKIWTHHSDALSFVKPRDRIGIIIGTATAFAVSPNHNKYCTKVFVDELVVQSDLALLCYRMYIKTGDTLYPSKAKGKNDYWYELAECPRTTIEQGKVNSDTYYDYVAKIAHRFPRKEILVFLTHSGTWNGNSKKYNFPTDFGRASRSLVEDFSNVRILAARRKRGVHFRLTLERLGFTNNIRRA